MKDSLHRCKSHLVRFLSNLVGFEPVSLLAILVLRILRWIGQAGEGVHSITSRGEHVAVNVIVFIAGQTGLPVQIGHGRVEHLVCHTSRGRQDIVLNAQGEN